MGKKRKNWTPAMETRAKKLMNEGARNDEIGLVLGVSTNSVFKRRQAWVAAGLVPKARRGRPPKATSQKKTTSKKPAKGKVTKVNISTMGSLDAIDHALQVGQKEIQRLALYVQMLEKRNKALQAELNALKGKK